MNLILACLLSLVPMNSSLSSNTNALALLFNSGFASYHIEPNIAGDQGSEVDVETVANLINALDSPVFSIRNNAGAKLKAARDTALEQVFNHAVSSDSKLDSSAKCLALIRAWELDYDKVVHDRLTRLLEKAPKRSASNKNAISRIQAYLFEGFGCTESDAITLLTKMGATPLYIKKKGYYSIRLRSNCSRAIGKSLWPMQYLSSRCQVSFEHGVEIDDFVARNLGACPGLERIFCPNMTDAQIVFLGESKSLKELYLKGIMVEDGTILALSKIPTLELLSFDSNQTLTDSLRHLALFPSLNCIYLNRGDVSDPMVLDYLANCLKLNSLNLGSFDMPSGSFRNLKRFKSVTKLEMPRYADNKLIEMVSELPSVKTLEIEYGHMTDEAAPFLVMHKHLQELTIKNTFVSDETCKHLAKITTLTALRLDATFVTPAGVKQIEDAIPSLRVKGWITAAHDPAYIEALQQLQLIGCRVRPDFGVSFNKDKLGRATPPYRRLPGCDIFFAQSDDPKINDEFLKYAANVGDLRKLYLSKCNDEFAARLVTLPKSAKLMFSDSEVSESMVARLKLEFKAAN